MRKVPEFFYTTVRKVEPVSGNCVRLYCSVEQNGAWDDRLTLIIPINLILKNAKFVTESVSDLFSEVQGQMPAEGVGLH